MIGMVIRRLLDQKLTTIKELEEVTGRGTSTIYRWINGDSEPQFTDGEPQFTDVRLIVRHMRNPEARRTMISLLTSDLPIVVNWTTDDEFTVQDERGRKHDGHEILDRTLLALNCLTDVLSEQNEAIHRQRLTEDTFASLITMMDQTIHHLTASKNMLQGYAPVGQRRTDGAGSSSALSGPGGSHRSESEPDPK